MGNSDRSKLSRAASLHLDPINAQANRSQACKANLLESDSVFDFPVPNGKREYMVLKFKSLTKWKGSIRMIPTLKCKHTEPLSMLKNPIFAFQVATIVNMRLNLTNKGQFLNGLSEQLATHLLRSSKWNNSEQHCLFTSRLLLPAQDFIFQKKRKNSRLQS